MLSQTLISTDSDCVGTTELQRIKAAICKAFDVPQDLITCTERSQAERRQAEYRQLLDATCDVLHHGFEIEYKMAEQTPVTVIAMQANLLTPDEQQMLRSMCDAALADLRVQRPQVEEGDQPACDLALKLISSIRQKCG